MTKLDEKQKSAYDKIFSATTPEEIHKALDGFERALPPSSHAKRAKIAENLIEELDATPDLPAKKLSRLVTALATIDTPNAAEAVARYARCEPEHCDDRIQVWALVALSRMSIYENTCNLLTHVMAQDSTNSRVRALALRLLINCSRDDLEAARQHADSLSALAQEGNADQKWAVFRALRTDTDIEPLPSEIERRFITELMAPTLKEEFEWRDVQLQATLALGDVRHHLDEAMIQLATAYRLPTTPPTLRRYCIESMRAVAIRMKKTKRAQLDSSPFSAVMLQALEDDHSDARSRAEAALKKLYNSDGAVELIVAALLQPDAPTDHYVDALRHIHEDRASEALRNQLFHLDPDVAERASDALTQLGGEQAFRTLFGQRRQVIDQYTKILNNADERIMEQYNLIMRQARLAFWISIAMHSLVFLVGIVIFVAVLRGMSASGVESVGTSGGGGGSNGAADPMTILQSLFGVAGGVAAIMLGLFYKSPINNIGESVTRLVKVNVAFLGYMRQINQIDATFKQLFLDMSGFTLDEMKATVEQIHTVVDQSLTNIQTYLVTNESSTNKD